MGETLHEVLSEVLLRALHATLRLFCHKQRHQFTAPEQRHSASFGLGLNADFQSFQRIETFSRVWKLDDSF